MEHSRRKEEGCTGLIPLVEEMPLETEDAEAPRGVLGWRLWTDPRVWGRAGRDQVARQPGELPRPRQVGPGADTLRSPAETASQA